MMNQLSYTLEFQALVDSLPPAARKPFLQSYAAQSKDPAVAMILNCAIGVLGGDRFYIGDIVLGILKLLTLGGLFVWVLVDLFLIGGKVRAQNLQIARDIKNAMFFQPAPQPQDAATEPDLDQPFEN